MIIVSRLRGAFGSSDIKMSIWPKTFFLVSVFLECLEKYS